MKKMLTLAILMTIALASTAQNEDYMNMKQFDVKSGKIEYKIEGKTKGTKTLWFDDYGRFQYEHTVTTTKMFGMTSKEERLRIRDKEWMYDLNLVDKTGTKMHVDQANEMLNVVTDATTDEQLKKFGEDVQKDMDMKDGGMETILGRQCKVTTSGKLNSKHWEYKRIPLKMSVDFGGMLGSSIEEAISFEENISIPSSKFNVPSGFEIQEIDMNQINGLLGLPDDEE
ncbi:MAG: hypothetical protein FD155_1388 [Bacteroidetes bacterium]|nr:MAG: hypothetical protein FD155_1388 [Bacteroidota bacterium]